MQVIVEAEQVVRKQARRSGGGAVVYVPKAWIDRDVVVVLEPEQ